MNTPQNLDNPDLTAYALGELDDDQRLIVSAWIDQHPEAEPELDQVCELAHSLHTCAPLSSHRLHPHQRLAVLAGPQRVRELVAAASTAQRTQQQHRQKLNAWRVAKFAAAAAITFGVFIAGTHYGQRSIAEVTQASLPQPNTKLKKAEIAIAAAPKPATESPIAKPALSVPAIAAVSVTKPQPAPQVSPVPPKAKQPVVVATLPKAALPKEEATSARPPRLAIYSQAYTNATRDALTSLTLRPSETRPQPAKNSTPALGAPLPLDQAAKPAPTRSAKTPELLIHDWKAEVATCPWDESHRLVRLVLQVPGEQPAATSSDFAYALQVTFDPNYVRSYRLLAQRAVTPATMDAAAVHVAWYELTPNGIQNETATRNLGRVTLPGARFTTQVMTPFDGTAMQILDRSTHWQNSREDFLFETALVGFGLLLRGEKDIGSLDHALVLHLAEKSASDDRTGERHKFVKLVKQAQQSAGL